MTTVKEYNFGLNCGIADVTQWDHFHRHSEIEVTFVVDGYVSLQIHNKRIQIEPGKLFIFWGGLPHLFSKVCDNQHQYWLCIPLPIFFQWFHNPDFIKQVLTYGLMLPASEKYVQADNLLFPLWQEELRSESQLIRQAAQYSIRARVYRALAESGFSPPDYIPSINSCGGYSSPSTSGKLFHRVCEYILENFTDSELSVDTIACAVKAHPKYIISLFKNKYGISINNFVLLLRISEAQNLLVNSKTKVIDVALQSGFSSLSGFYSTFHRLVGKRPMDLRSH